VDLGNTALVLAWPGNKGGARDELVALITKRLGLRYVYPWSSSGRDKDLYPELPINIHQTIVLPVFMCPGFTLRNILPGLIDHILDSTNSEVTCLQPIGQHTEMAAMIAKRAALTAQSNKVAPEDIHLILVAHGSEKHPESALSTQKIMKRIRATNLFASVQESYLEQSPSPESIIPNLDGPVIAEGLFLTTGWHFNEDFPAAIARCNRSVLMPPAGGLSTDPMFGDVICDALKHAIGV